MICLQNKILLLLYTYVIMYEHTYAMLFYVMPCCAALHYDYVILCYVMLCYTSCSLLHYVTTVVKTYPLIDPIVAPLILITFIRVTFIYPRA